MSSEDRAKFVKEFGPRVNALVERLHKAANVGKGPMGLGKLDILVAASMELLTSALANLPEPMRGERIRGLSATLARDVAQKRRRIEQKIPNRKLDALRQTPPKGSA